MTASRDEQDQLLLPEGLTLAEWSRERSHWQNPRIRAFLGCMRLLGTVMESNYAILHCSPERLLEIWRKVREVADLMLTRLAPLLDNPSPVPAVEEARAHAEMALTLLADTVLDDLHRLPRDVPPKRMMEVRKLLCVSIGKIYAYLQDTFGQIVASDPRSLHDADYFLSKRFPQDVEEAEWLHATVGRLRDYLDDIEGERRRFLGQVIDRLRREQTAPTAERWRSTRELLVQLVEDLTPRLKEVLALRGIRFHEMEILDRYATELPIQCYRVIELFDAVREASARIKSTIGPSRAEREQAISDIVQCHDVHSERMADLMSAIDYTLRDLRAFIPLWLDGIQMRRALILKRSGDDDGETSDHDPFGAKHDF